MIKVYARQVPPEYQESPLFFGDWDENVFVFGNRHYNEHDEQLEDIRGSLDAIACALEDMHGGYGWRKDDNLNVLLQDYFPRENPYTRAERLQFVQLANAYCESSSDEIRILRGALELVTGQEWSGATIRGCCQGDWQNVIYPAAYGPEWLEAFEIEYFNAGTEWIIHDGETPPECPEDVNGYSVYCLGWSAEKIRAEIAEYANVSPENVVLYNFTGWTRSAAYREA